MRRPFLSAQWRSLAMLNYAVEPALLEPMVPRGVMLDQFGGKTYVSLVGFRFLQTRVRGIWIPFHSDFDEVNLRFYVRRDDPTGPRRGVVFIREVVPRFAVAQVARLVFHENYVARRMSHRLQAKDSENGPGVAEYAWGRAENWSSIRVEWEGAPKLAREGSLEQFITEHYWGYSAQPGGSSLEYEVEHAPWRLWTAKRAAFEGKPVDLYGEQLAACLKREPESAFLAEGGPVTVYYGSRIG